MASQRVLRPFRCLVTTKRSSRRASCVLRPHLSKNLRTLSTPAAPSINAQQSNATETAYNSYTSKHMNNGIPSHIQQPTVLTTLYSFPELEPLNFLRYSSQLLDIPFRKDILHRAVIFEADGKRQGTASTKWRSEVRGSGRKIRPQKGTGMARLGDKKSPMLRGGGVAHGPKPRDFSTDLPQKIYDLAWLTALSYRRRQGELVVVNLPDTLQSSQRGYLESVFDTNGWGRRGGRSLLITDWKHEDLYQATKDDFPLGRLRSMEEENVELKDLLMFGRVIIEQHALNRMLEIRSQHRAPLEALSIGV